MQYNSRVSTAAVADYYQLKYICVGSKCGTDGVAFQRSLDNNSQPDETNATRHGATNTLSYPVLLQTTGFWPLVFLCNVDD